MNTRKIGAVAPWFGSNRKNPSLVGMLLGRRSWVGVPFAGGMAELPYISTRAGVANDLHRHVINLARVIRDRPAELVQRLDGMTFHPDELAEAQRICKRRERIPHGFFDSDAVDDLPDAFAGAGFLDWAAAYFVAAWMTRGGLAGTDAEFAGSLAVRWSSAGGASSTRFRSAVESLRGWAESLKLWEFSTLDAFKFLDKCKDQADHGIYADPPWIDLGAGYKFTPEGGWDWHGRLAERLSAFDRTRVVVRYGDHPEIVRLYSGSGWRIDRLESINQNGNPVAEVLISKNGEPSPDGTSTQSGGAVAADTGKNSDVPENTTEPGGTSLGSSEFAQ